MLRGTLHATALVERRRTQAIIDSILHQSITASTESPLSLSLRNIANQFGSIFLPDVAAGLRETHIFGVDLPLVNAFAQVERDQRQIVVYEGLMQLAKFYLDQTWIVNLLVLSPSGERVRIGGSAFLDKIEMDEAVAFSTASWLMIEHFIESGSPLVSVDDLLGPSVQRYVAYGYLCTMAFVLAHEYGHLFLGHTEGGRTTARRNFSLAVEESLTRSRADEFAADEFAIRAFLPEIQSSFLNAGLMFFGQQGFLESFETGTDSSHPIGINRFSELSTAAGSEEATASSAGLSEAAIQMYRAMEIQVKGFENLGVILGRPDKSGRELLRELMPVKAAYDVIHRIKARVKERVGVLEAS